MFASPSHPLIAALRRGAAYVKAFALLEEPAPFPLIELDARVTHPAAARSQLRRSARHRRRCDLDTRRPRDERTLQNDERTLQNDERTLQNDERVALAGDPLSEEPAATYSPRPLRAKYHRR